MQAVTSQPRIMSSFTRLRPTNPVPPVTNAARVLGGIGGLCGLGDLCRIWFIA